MRAEPCPAVGRGCRGAGLGAAPPPHMPTPPAPHRRCPPTQTARDGDGGCVELCRTAGRAPLLAQPPPAPPQRGALHGMGGPSAGAVGVKTGTAPPLPGSRFSFFVCIFFFLSFQNTNGAGGEGGAGGREGEEEQPPGSPPAAAELCPSPFGCCWLRGGWWWCRPAGLRPAQLITVLTPLPPFSLLGAQRVLLLSSLCTPPPHTQYTQPPSQPSVRYWGPGGGGLLCIWPIPAGCIQQRNPAGVPPAASALPAACLPLLLLSV